MANGFTVQPDKLEAFRAEVENVAESYEEIVAQLARARLGPADEETMKSVLGAPELLGPSGPPVDFTNASRTLLTSYDSLLETLHRLHVAVGARLAHTDRALGETHALYSRLDREHADVFHNLLDERSDGS